MDWSTGAEAQSGWERVTKHGTFEELSPGGTPALAPGEKIVAASPAIPLNEGVAECNEAEENFQSQEHIHFQILLSEEAGQYCKKIGAESLGILLALTLRVQISSKRLAFSEDAIKDLPQFVVRLRQKADPLSAFLWQRLSSFDQAALSDFQPSEPDSPRAREIATRVLNIAIWGPAIYDHERFRNIRLRPEVAYLAKQAHTGIALSRLNRMLLEDAFTLELWRLPEESSDYRTCTFPLSGCCFLTEFEAEKEQIKYLLQIRLDCGGLLRVFPILAGEIMPSDTEVESHELRLFIITSE
jgi:hypothetical protein